MTKEAECSSKVLASLVLPPPSELWIHYNNCVSPVFSNNSDKSFSIKIPTEVVELRYNAFSICVHKYKFITACKCKGCVSVHGGGWKTPALLWADDPLGRLPPPLECMLAYCQQAGGTHPTRMHSCFNDCSYQSIRSANWLFPRFH